jgi:dipeptidyl-peptidase-4
MTESTATPMLDRYQRAQALFHGRFSKSQAFNTTLFPHWIEGTDCFWYRCDLDNSGAGEYRLVDASAGTQKSAFGHQALAKALAQASGESVDPSHLPLSELQLSPCCNTLTFRAFEQCWQFDDRTATLLKQPTIAPLWQVSPDGKQAVFCREYNLWLANLETGKEQPLSTDGDAHYIYGGTATAYGREEMPSLEVLWSADSRRVLAVIKDNRQVPLGPPLVEHVPSDGSVKPRLVDADRRVAMPGDEHIECYHLVAFDIDSSKIIKADYPPCPVFAPIYVGFFTGKRGWWSADHRHAYFIDLLRGGNTGRLLAFDTHTGEVRTVIEETSKHRLCLIPDTHLGAMLAPLPATEEVIWYSERSGSAHLYLYDLNTGELKNPITTGPYVVRGVLHVDQQRREVWIQTSSRIDARHPVYCDIARVNIDTGELIEVVSTDHEYVVANPTSRVSMMQKHSAGVAPSANYVVTTRSRVDEAPVSILLDRDGQQIMEIAAADISALPDNWQWPEQALITAADGETVLDAVIWRPSDFDPQHSYPVIDGSWGAFPPPVGSFTNNMSQARLYLEAAAMAELGFIVVMVGQRGAGIGSGMAGGIRNVACSNSHEHWNCISPNMVDIVAGIKQLAADRSYMDINRVGIGLFPSMASAVGGMLRFPDFYKVGVSCNAYSDLRLAGEFFSYTGSAIPDDALSGHPFLDMAPKLKGKLMLMHGMMNPCIPVSATFGFVDALHRANKDFDQLILPSLGHGTNDFNDYTARRRWDYFVEHLLGETPPKEFDLGDPCA